MSIFQKRELSSGGGTEPTPPRAAVCFTTSAMTRRAADWLARLGGCRPLGILSDHGEDVIWQCEAENVDLLLLETDFSPAAEDTKDVSARCDIAIEGVKGAAKLFDQRTGEKERVIVSLAHWQHSSFQIPVRREHVQCGS